MCDKLQSACDLDSNNPESVDSLTKSITILDTITMGNLTWKTLTSQTIVNCYRKAGFSQVPQLSVILSISTIQKQSR